MGGGWISVVVYMKDVSFESLNDENLVDSLGEGGDRGSRITILRQFCPTFTFTNENSQLHARFKLSERLVIA